MRSRVGFLAGVLIVAALLGGVTASSVTAATSTTVTWKVSSLTAGQIKSLSAIATSNSPGVKTWSKTGSCVLSPNSKPMKLTMGTGGSCTLTLKIAKTSKYSAKTSLTTITRKLTIPTTTTTTVPTTTTTTVPTTTTTTVPTTTTTVALTCATGGSCALGDVGPAGGKIFITPSTAGNTTGKYFEAACVGWSDGICGGSDLMDPGIAWGCSGTLIPGALGYTIGTGEQNTADIVTGCSETRFAAKVANSLVLGGQTDWFLPSDLELYTMIFGDGGIYLTNCCYYWTSRGYGAEHASYWATNFAGQSMTYKIYALPVRPIRSF